MSKEIEWAQPRSPEARQSTDVLAVANKIRNEADRAAVRQFCEAHRLRVVAEVPYDPTLVDAEREGRPPIDYDDRAPAVVAIEKLADTLMRAREPAHGRAMVCVAGLDQRN